MGALDKQIAGGHYKDMAIQPVEYIVKNGIEYREGNVIKYVSRYKSKNGLQDLKKARHYLDMIIEDLEAEQEQANFEEAYQAMTKRQVVFDK